MRFSRTSGLMQNLLNDGSSPEIHQRRWEMRQVAPSPALTTSWLGLFPTRMLTLLKVMYLP